LLISPDIVSVRSSVGVKTEFLYSVMKIFGVFGAMVWNYLVLLLTMVSFGISVQTIMHTHKLE